MSKKHIIFIDPLQYFREHQEIMLQVHQMDIKQWAWQRSPPDILFSHLAIAILTDDDRHNVIPVEVNTILICPQCFLDMISFDFESDDEKESEWQCRSCGFKSPIALAMIKEAPQCMWFDGCHCKKSKRLYRNNLCPFSKDNQKYCEERPKVEKSSEKTAEEIALIRKRARKAWDSLIGDKESDEKSK